MEEGGGQEVTLTLLICEGVGEGGGGRGNVRERIWVWVGTGESMQDLALHHKEYTFAATNGTFLNTFKKQKL